MGTQLVRKVLYDGIERIIDKFYDKCDCIRRFQGETPMIRNKDWKPSDNDAFCLQDNGFAILTELTISHNAAREIKPYSSNNKPTKFDFDILSIIVKV